MGWLTPNLFLNWNDLFQPMPYWMFGRNHQGTIPPRTLIFQSSNTQTWMPKLYEHAPENQRKSLPMKEWSERWGITCGRLSYMFSTYLKIVKQLQSQMKLGLTELELFLVRFLVFTLLWVIRIKPNRVVLLSFGG